MSGSPPRRAERLVRWSLAPWERPAILGDLNEEFNALSLVSQRRAHRWYWRQVLFSVWPNLLRRFRGDERRREAAQVGALYLAIALLDFLVRLTSTRRPPRFHVLGWLLVLASLILFDSFFRKRLRQRPRSQRRLTTLQQVVAAATIFGVSALVSRAMNALEISEQQFTAAMVALLLTSYVWPRSKATNADAEFSVRHKVASDLEREALLTLTVPNEPLGLSSLVFCIETPGELLKDGPPTLRTYDTTVVREFRTNQLVRVCAYVNVQGADAGRGNPKPRAGLDIIDSTGQVVKTVTPSMAIGPLEQTSESWDDFADDDPAEHFGQIDVMLPLAELAPGFYRIRVRAADVAHNSAREEAIAIRG